MVRFDLRPARTNCQRRLASHHCGGDDGHLVDLVGIAATAKVVDGSSQTLQDGAQSLVATQTLGDLVTDVAGLDGGEDEGVGVAGNGRAGEIQSNYTIAAVMMAIL